MCYWLGLLLLLTPEQRAAELVSRMTLGEKVSQMQNAAPAIPRLGIPAYDWWNEALHGVARAGLATVFPQAIGLAATWDSNLEYRIADAISTEARAKYNDAIRRDDHSRYHGLTFWSPNINIFRDPRWGRGQETYGEDPYLTARMAVAFIKGMQGNDPQYFKTIATSKHFAVHSGPEASRHEFDARASQQDLEETYLYAFRATLRDGGAQSVMCAYNSVNGAPACANTFLLQDTLRRDWGFQGYVVSDCGAVGDIYRGHHYAGSLAEASAKAVKAGTDLDCGSEYRSLLEAVKKGYIKEEEIDRSVERLFAARIRLGIFDPPERVPFSTIGMDQVDSPRHRRLSLEAAEKSIVLLKNSGSILPLRNVPKTIAVIGPAANDPDTLLGNYNGTPSHIVTPLQGIEQKFAGRAEVRFAQGSGYVESDDAMLREAMKTAHESDLAIVCVGLNPKLEGEESKLDIPGFSHGDRTDINLPGPQEKLLEAVLDTGKPTLVVLINGSALAVIATKERAQAIIEAWYPGQEGGTAIANTLTGENNPGGRLPVTFYESVNQLPPFADHSMKDRTYRYFQGKPLYPFGYGLSYSEFQYSKLFVRKERGSGRFDVTAMVSNHSAYDGDEVVELYLTGGTTLNPELRGFQRVHLARGEGKQVRFEIDEADAKGWRSVSIGGGQPRKEWTGAGYLQAGLPK